MRLLLVLALATMLQTSAIASFSFVIDLPTEFDLSQAGTTVSRDVFLAAAPADNFVSANTVEFNLDAAQAPGNTTITGFSIDNANFPGGLFTGPSSATLTATGVNARLYSNGTPSVANQIRLGSVSLLLGTGGNSTQLTFSDPGATAQSPSGNNVNVFAPLQTNIDSQVFPSFANVNVSAVPEPSSLALLGLGTIAAFGRSIRGMRRKK
jgi:hypothetical protein